MGPETRDSRKGIRASLRDAERSGEKPIPFDKLRAGSPIRRCHLPETAPVGMPILIYCGGYPARLVEMTTFMSSRSEMGH
jgi:hypothetical protein